MARHRNHTLRCVLHPSTLLLRSRCSKCKTRLASRIKKFKPHFIYAWVFSTVKINVDEVGIIGGRYCPVKTLFTTDKAYWNIAASLWGYYYGELARLGSTVPLGFGRTVVVVGLDLNTWIYTREIVCCCTVLLLV